MTRIPLVLLSLLLAIGIPIFVELIDEDFFTSSEEFLVGLVVLITTTALETLYQVSRLVHSQDRMLSTWESRTELDVRLTEVRTMFHALDQDRRSDNDLFFSYLSAKLAELDRALRDASSKSEIQINETMFAVTSWLLESTLDDGVGWPLRAVHLCEDEDFFFDIHAQRYFKQVFERVEDNSISEVQRLIVFEKDAQLTSDRTQALIEFHRRRPKYDCRLISLESFLRITTDYQLHHLVKDFGVYGSSYVYKGLTNRRDEIVGVYCRDKTEITQFTDCFDTLWQSAKTPTIPLPYAHRPMQLKEFISRVS